jgi:hypothetical protein
LSEDALAALNCGFAPICPFKRKNLSRKTFSRVTYDKPCNSWACCECGPRLADALLHVLEWRLSQLDANEVYIAEADWRPGLAAMVRNRKVKAGFFWYRDVTGKVTYVADRPIPGDLPPNVWWKVTKAEAIDHMKDAVMWVPGHVDDGWSTNWRPVRDERGSGDLISLDGLTEAQIAHIMETFSDQAQENWEVDIDSGVIPDDRRPDLVQLLESIVEQVKKVGW